MFLKYIAIGDAYGRSFEFNTDKFISKNNLGTNYVLREKETIKSLGLYTDDAQMSMALVEHLIQKKSFDFINLSNSFVDTFLRNPHLGYSKRLLASFKDAKDADFAKRGLTFFNSNQTTTLVHSNGTAMRAIPIGVLKSEGHVIRGSQIQSLITHCSHDASISAQLIAITSHYFYYNKHNNNYSFNNYKKYLKTLNLDTYLDICLKKYEKHYFKYQTIPCDGEITVGCVISLLFTCKSYKEILIKSINMTGDVDSIASITLGLASMISIIKNDLADKLYIDLENKKYGYDYISELDNKILKLYPRNNI